MGKIYNLEKALKNCGFRAQTDHGLRNESRSACFVSQNVFTLFGGKAQEITVLVNAMNGETCSRLHGTRSSESA